MKISIPALLTIVFATTLHSQPFRGPGAGAVDRVEQLRKVRMIEALDLSEDQSIRFFARLHEYDKAKQALMDEKDRVLDRLDRLIRNGANDEEYRHLYPDYKEIDSRLDEEFNGFFDGLTDILSEEQRAKFLLFGRQFDRELRDALQQLHRRREGG